MKNFDVDIVTSAWTSLVENVGELKAIESEEDFSRAVEQLDAILEVTRGKEGHALLSLVALIGNLVEAFELRELNEPDAPPTEVLRVLMSSNGLKQKDLAKEFGGQSVVSQVLSGRREITSRQAGALAARFGVSAAAFIAKPASAEVLGVAAAAIGPSKEARQLKYGRQKPAFTGSNAPLTSGKSLRVARTLGSTWNPKVFRLEQSQYVQ